MVQEAKMRRCGIKIKFKLRGLRREKEEDAENYMDEKLQTG